jgi:hypothetical protein
MDPVEFSWRLVENQGVVALVLLIMMLQNSKERAALLHKNCELSHFIMDCLRQKLDEDNPNNKTAQGSTGLDQGGHLSSEGSKRLIG